MPLHARLTLSLEIGLAERRPRGACACVRESECVLTIACVFVAGQASVTAYACLIQSVLFVGTQLVTSSP